MDKIILNRIELLGKIGVLEEEKRRAQRYLVSIVIRADIKVAGRTDRLGETIDYGHVFEMAKSLMDVSDCELIECYAECLAGQILTTFPKAKSVTVEVLKPDAPIEGSFESVGIEITRTQGD
ncbi:MAG: dihydroneopterin aldolase [Opitutales bacterium]|jgi:dihydroneopterin aldolase|nr:dihydroneopterin aldolase [Opitutales bacterium]MDG2255893.1 dihydroneopterin aldolase [Opitutaceae bacterium]MBT5167603.1 dihydroneopterin aldolase [Opitutales bacterium]MBT5813198.1 dihydroneopterin aldolase [Opitutales bacterium]MBT6380846.1 dihydroneopterin aldolase [Opitutales bacterium]